MESSTANNPVKEFFDQQVSSYPLNFSALRSGASFRFNKRLNSVATLCSQSSGALLDCAVGSGEVSTAVICSGKFTRASLVDISPGMLALARARIQKSNVAASCEFIEADIFTYLKTLSGSSFDIVLCLGLIAHTGRLLELLQLIHPLLKPDGGRLVLQSSLLDNPGCRLERALTKRRYEKGKGYAITDYYLRDIKTASDKSKLRITRVIRFGLHIPFGDRIWPKANLFMEKAFENLAAQFGSEALFVMERSAE